MDLIGRERGKGTGRGGIGHLWQGPGTITPCAEALAAARNKAITSIEIN
jgi:hypothetical protein